MRVRWSVAVLAAGLVASGPSWAADKHQSTLAQPGGFIGTTPPPLAGALSSAWVNGTSKGRLRRIGCKVQIKLSGTTLGTGDGIAGTGDEVICLGDANLHYEATDYQTTAIFRGERVAGSVKIALDLQAEGTDCGTESVVAYDLRLTCYEPDPTYAP